MFFCHQHLVGTDDESYPSTIRRAPVPPTSVASTTNVMSSTSPTSLTREDSSSMKGRHRSRQQQHRRKGSNRRHRQHIQQHLQHQTPKSYKTLAGSSASSSAAEDEEGESTLSFCSAPSENDDFDLSGSDVDAEDLIDMINLHNHMNLPITESPLLLSCYSQHLSHYYCQVCSDKIQGFLNLSVKW